MFFIADCISGVTIVNADDVSHAQYIAPAGFAMALSDLPEDSIIYTYLPGDSGKAYAEELETVLGYTVNA